MWQGEFVKLLDRLYSDLRKKNPSFSKRAYAKKIGVSSGTLSDIMNGKLFVTPKRAQAMLTKLELDAESLHEFSIMAKAGVTSPRKSVPENIFASITDWPIRALFTAYDLIPQATDGEIASRLDVSEEKVRNLKNQLVDLGMLKLDSKNGISKNEDVWQTTDGPANEHVRKMHLSDLKLSEFALEKIPARERHFGSLMVTGNRKQFELVKKEVREMHERIQALLAKGPQEEVFQIAVQAFPVNLKRRESQ